MLELTTGTKIMLIGGLFEIVCQVQPQYSQLWYQSIINKIGLIFRYILLISKWIKHEPKFGNEFLMKMLIALGINEVSSNK